MRQGLKTLFCIALLWSFLPNMSAQRIRLGEPEKQMVSSKAANAYISFRSNGGGIGFQM